MLNLVYSAIKKRLAAQVLPLPKYVDWYYAQYLEDEMEDGGQLLWQTPALFVEFLPIEWETRPQNIQTSTLRFNTHLVNESFYDNDQRVLDAAVNHLGQESSVFVALMNWRCMLSYVPGFEALADTANDRVLLESIVRESSEPDHTMRRQLVGVQRFACRIYDYSAQPQWAQVLAALSLDVQIVDSLD